MVEGALLVGRLRASPCIRRGLNTLERWWGAGGFVLVLGWSLHGASMSAHGGGAVVAVYTPMPSYCICLKCGCRPSLLGWRLFRNQRVIHCSVRHAFGWFCGWERRRIFWSRLHRFLAVGGEGSRLPPCAGGSAASWCTAIAG